MSNFEGKCPQCSTKEFSCRFYGVSISNLLGKLTCNKCGYVLDLDINKEAVKAKGRKTND